MRSRPDRYVAVIRDLLLAAILLPATVPANTMLRMQTDLGGVDIELFDVDTPNTVQNFMNYVLDGDYEGTFIHRSETDFVLQMGGFVFDTNRGVFTDNSGIFHILTDPPVVNEPGIPNTRGTITMAKIAGNPDSATSEFFFNLADNSASLDAQNGGFTVFGMVLGNGMDLIDTIAALDRCTDIGFLLPRPCNNFPTVPLVGIEATSGAIFTTPVEQVNLVNILNIGVDSDGDGIIDTVEDAAPNSGNGNGDAFADKTQSTVASFLTQNNAYVTLQTLPSIDIQDTDTLGVTFALTTIDPFDPNNALAGLSILEGFFGTTLTGVAPFGSATTITLTLPATDVPDNFLMFGPTPADATPHWYPFIDNGETGAMFFGNTVTLTYVDGKRGDADLTENGVIVVSPGGAIRNPGDNDGISDGIEDGAPNNGDGNNDSIPDRDQDHVVSLPDLHGNYLTLETASSYRLRGVAFTAGAAILTVSLPTGGQIANPNIPTDLVTGLNFAHDFLRFELANLPQGGPSPASADVKIILPVGEAPTRFLKFGPTPADPTNHVYDFSFDPASGTGAEFNDNVVTLHFVDGGRGDSDLTENGVIMDPGAVALPISITTDSGGGGGCSLRGTAGSPWQAGGWWLLLGLLLGCRVRTAYYRRS